MNGLVCFAFANRTSSVVLVAALHVPCAGGAVCCVVACVRERLNSGLLLEPSAGAVDKTASLVRRVGATRVALRFTGLFPSLLTRRVAAQVLPSVASSGAVVAASL